MKEKKKSTFWADFKAFITKGNILQLAIAVIIGAAFGKIIAALVDQIIMPLISLAFGGVSFADLKWVIKPAEYDTLGVLMKNETALGYGLFIQATIDFLIIAFCIFLFIRLVTRAQTGLKKPKTDSPAAPAEPPKPTQEELLAEIRDLIKLQTKKGE